MSGIEITQFEFDQSPYVLIHIAVGSTPPKGVAARLTAFREKSRLCQLLDSRDIPCDIVPVRVDSFHYPHQSQPTEDMDDRLEELESEIEDAKGEALCGIDELRDELVEAKLLPEGPSLEDFGLQLEKSGLTVPGLLLNDSPKFKPRELTETEEDHKQEQIMKWVDEVANHDFK